METFWFFRLRLCCAEDSAHDSEFWFAQGLICALTTPLTIPTPTPNSFREPKVEKLANEEVLKCTHSSSGIKFELYSGQSKKLVAVVVVVVVTEKPEIHFPGPAVRAMKGLWLECSATGTPPIQITINQNGTQLVKGTGFAKVPIANEGEYRCTARNEAGTDSKEIIVSFPTSKCNHP